MEVQVEDCKKITTFAPSGQENGFLVELFKNGEKTQLYLSSIKPGAFKGYHLHKVRSARYFCVKGKVKIITYIDNQREEHVLDEAVPQRLFIPSGVPTGLENIGEEEVWLINYPDPAYDPNLKDEQVEYTQEELEKGIVKD